MINVWTRPKDGASVETAKLNYADGVAVGDGEWRVATVNEIMWFCNLNEYYLNRGLRSPKTNIDVLTSSPFTIITFSQKTPHTFKITI